MTYYQEIMCPNCSCNVSTLNLRVDNAIFLSGQGCVDIWVAPWSFVGKKSNQRWWWHAVDHATNTVIAYVFGERKDAVFQKLTSLLSPFNIGRYYTDDWGDYERYLNAEEHEIGKTQKKLAIVHILPKVVYTFPFHALTKWEVGL